MKVLLSDHDDSFTYNLALYLEEQTGVDVLIKNHHTVTSGDLLDCDAIVFSPGPGLPSDFPNLIPTIQTYYNQIPILGICLGMQAIHMAFGGTLRNLDQVKHGTTSILHVEDEEDAFWRSITRPVSVGRYHSWVCDESMIHNDLLVTARDEAGDIMALRHKQYPLFGVQFHPESILTPEGKKMIHNFIQIANHLKSTK